MDNEVVIFSQYQIKEISQKSIKKINMNSIRYLIKFRYNLKFDIWMPHALTARRMEEWNKFFGSIYD